METRTHKRHTEFAWKHAITGSAHFLHEYFPPQRHELCTFSCAVLDFFSLQQTAMIQDHAPLPSPRLRVASRVVHTCAYVRATLLLYWPEPGQSYMLRATARHLPAERGTDLSLTDQRYVDMQRPAMVRNMLLLSSIAWCFRL